MAHSARSKDYFRYCGRVRFQATAWELYPFEPVPDFQCINEVNYTRSLGHCDSHASVLQSPSLLRVLLKLNDEQETSAIEFFRLTT
ncbi:unnamed protein product [Lasius platythorax]|uniref:Uncharacterized protein n=1 Tax=Lasius platythorax TaxID=488582 RepID=A0AAV2NVV9_9HYME